MTRSSHISTVIVSCILLWLIAACDGGERLAPVAADVEQAAIGEGALPALLASAQLAEHGDELVDLALDPEGGNLFVSDSAGRTHVLDSDSYDTVATIDAAGALTLDAIHRRLYAAPQTAYMANGEQAAITVIDADSYQIVGRLPGRYVALDSRANRLFVGEHLMPAEDEQEHIRIYDGVTLEQTGEIDAAGVPVYNPLRDELLVVAYTVLLADPDTGEVIVDLLPDVSAGQPRWCNGCEWVDAARVFPDANLMAFDIQAHCAGKGCGEIAPPRFMDATSLAPVSPDAAPELYPGCGSNIDLVQSTDGKIVRNRTFNRYLVFNNLTRLTPEGDAALMRDGLHAVFENRRTGQAYLRDGQVLNAETLSPMGSWPYACLFAYDEASGLIYGALDNNLHIISETGGEVLQPSPPVPQPLPARRITAIEISPAFADDATLLVTVDGGELYRSTDGGANWARLHGGLPEGEFLTVGARFSPDVSADNTLYAFGHRDTFWGEGVLVSTDRGDSWTRLWNGLSHLRVQQLMVSPAFSTDRSLLVLAGFFDVASSANGVSFHLSRDGGATWHLVAQADDENNLPLPSDFLPVTSLPSVSSPVRIADYGMSLEYSADGGANWQPAAIRLTEDERIIELLQAGRAAGTEIYAIGDKSLWRSLDQGKNWAAWVDSRLTDRDYTNDIEVAAMTTGSDGGTRLFLGTANGEIWALDPTRISWSKTEISPAVTQAKSPLPLPTVTPTPLPAATAAPTPLPLDGEPPEGYFRPTGPFGEMWAEDPELQRILGWARQLEPTSTGSALQPFERGFMIWRADNSRLYVLYAGNGWEEFPDSFEEGQTERDPSLQPPGNLQQPVRGFGAIWRDKPAVREQLGWALLKEEPFDALAQEFERGLIMQIGARVHVLGNDPDIGAVWRR